MRVSFIFCHWTSKLAKKKTANKQIKAQRHKKYYFILHTYAPLPPRTSRLVEQRHCFFFAFGGRPVHRRAPEQTFVVDGGGFRVGLFAY